MIPGFGRSEVVIIYPELLIDDCPSYKPADCHLPLSIDSAVHWAAGRVPWAKRTWILKASESIWKPKLSQWTLSWDHLYMVDVTDVHSFCLDGGYEKITLNSYIHWKIDGGYTLQICIIYIHWKHLKDIVTSGVLSILSSKSQVSHLIPFFLFKYSNSPPRSK